MELDLYSIVEDLMVMKESCRNENVQPKDYSVANGTVEQTPTGLNTMVGFDEYLNLIKDQLCGQSSQLRVISIVGMAGIGKTTLAINTFDDALIAYHFHYRAWVTVSQRYHLDRVLQSILNSMGIATHDLRGKEELKELIYKSLKGQRYLIVLDDVWHTKVRNDVKLLFPNDNNGSRILLTTRLTDVAHHASNFGFVHEMQFLDVNASWNLLQNKVLAQALCPPELEDVGKLIAGKCQGLPLALVVIAGILSNTRTQLYWKSVARNVGSFLNLDDEHLSNVLSLSYNHLSHPLKACLLYIGDFPEDYVINISRLTRLWVAEGFLKSIGGSKTLEQVAEGYLEDLVKRNLVLITKKRANGKFKSCALHDVVRDFCRQRAAHEHFFDKIDGEWYLCTFGAGSAHRIISYSNTHCEPREFDTCKYVCTLLRLNGQIFDFRLRWQKYKLLKSLDISDIECHSDMLILSWMFYLKYITLRLRWKCEIESLLPSILKHCNLQTLVIIIINTRRFYIPLPFEFWQMLQVRHVIIDQMLLPDTTSLAGGVCVRILEDLQTLGTVHNFKFTDEVIGMIPNIKTLKILCGPYVNRLCGPDVSHLWAPVGSNLWEYYCLGNLVHLHRLVELRVTLKTNHIDSNFFPSSFAFPQNLEKLSLEGCRLLWNNLTVVGSLPCLQVLKLRDDALVGEEWEPVEGEFSQLIFLLIDILHDLKHWRAHDMHFPCLQHLKIILCNNLEEIPLEIGDIPTLESITIVDSSSGAVESAKRIREEQWSQGNDTLQVSVLNST